MPAAALQLARSIDATAGTALLATDCDFRPSASAAHDRAALGEAGIGRIVVDVASWPKLVEGGWRGAIRGIIDETMLTEGDLQPLHERGVRAVRVRLDRADDAGILPALADRIARFGWHIEIDAPLRADAFVLAPAEWTLAELPVATCFANFGGYDPRLPLDHPDVALLLDLVRIGRGWIKLSDAAQAPTQPAGGFKPFLAKLLECRSDRIVWGSGLRREQPASRPLSAGIECMVCDAAERRMILSQNPARLYGFDG